MSETGQTVREVKEGVIQIKSHTQHVSALDVSGDYSKLVTGSLDGTANIYDTKTWELLGTIHHDRAIRRVFFLPDNMVLTVGIRGAICVWSDYSNEQENSDIPIQLPHSEGAWELDYNHDGSMLALNAWGHGQVILGERLISGGHDNALRFWDWQIQKNIFTIKQEYYPLDVCFSPDGSDLASTDGRPEQIWIRRTMHWKE